VESNSKEWHLFREWVGAEAQTLLQIDCVDFEEANEKLKESIQRESVVLYEQDGN
jgi:hypothetical protein